jgi:hypothetical protein
MSLCFNTFHDLIIFVWMLNILFISVEFPHKIIRCDSEELE